MNKIFSILFLLISSLAMRAQSVKSVKVTELEKTIRDSKTPLIVNFWSTYCKPCIEEIPYFLELKDKYKAGNVSILFVSLDLQESYPAKVNALVKKLKMNPPGVWLNETDADYFCPKIDPKWSGGMPSSLFINNATGYRKFYEEQVPKEKLEAEIKSMLALPQ